MARQTTSAYRGVGWDPSRGKIGHENGPAERVTTAQARAMFGVSAQVWKDWVRLGWVPRGERAGERGPRWYDPVALAGVVEALLEEGRPRLDPRGKPGEAGSHPGGQPGAGFEGCWLLPLARSFRRRRDPLREVLIDGEDLGLVAGRRLGWASGGLYGGFVTYSVGETTAPLHRLIMGVEEPGLRVIHRNRDPLDCRRSNLEVRTDAEAVVRNRKMGSVSGRVYSSRFKGVSYVKRVGRWRMQLSKGGKKLASGYFEDEAEAARAYDRAAWDAFGPGAYLNFPGDFGRTHEDGADEAGRVVGSVVRGAEALERRAA